MRDKLTAAIAGAVGALVAVAVMGATGDGQTSTTIRAERFEVVDQDGKVVAALDATSEDGPRLMLFDGAGKTRVWLNVTKDGPGLTLYDGAGKDRISLDVTKNDSGLTLYDAKGKGRVWLNVRKDGPGLTLYDAPGKERVGLGVTKDGPGLTLYDAAEKKRAALGSSGLETSGTGAPERTSEGSLALFDKDGKVLWKMP